MRLAISCVYWDPQSMMTIFSFSIPGVGFMAAPITSGASFSRTKQVYQKGRRKKERPPPKRRPE
jgi:hypothetical protein